MIRVTQCGSSITSTKNFRRRKEESMWLEMRKGFKEDRIKKKEIKEQKNKGAQ